MRGQSGISTLFICVLFLILVQPMHAQVIHVDANGTGDYPTIQAAIDNASDSDTIILQPGTYTGEGNRDIDFLGKAITVRSTDPNDPNIVATTIIDCSGTEPNWHRGFHFRGKDIGPDSIVEGITITGGRLDGGGIYCGDYTSPTIRCCRIIGNSGMRGGGIYIDYASEPIIARCLISQNRVDSESFQGEGGGIFCSIVSHAVITNCIVSNNHASGSYEYGGSGGGIHLSNCTATMRHCTIVQNTAGLGGGIFCNRYGEHEIGNCIVWANTATDSPQIAGTPSVSYCDVQGGYPGVRNINADPLLVRPITGDYHLTADSPCIDAGYRLYVPSYRETDFDNEPRIMGLQTDIGADEFTATPAATIDLEPKEMVFHADVNGLNPQSQTLRIVNPGFAVLLWQLTEDCPSLEVDADCGQSPGGTDSVDISVDISGLSSGRYDCKLIVTADDALNSPQAVNVTLYIRAGKYLHVPSQYLTIQSAINTSRDGDTIIIERGIYTGQGNRNIDFLGKAITVKSTEPNDPNVVAATIIDCEQESRAVNFNHSEGPDSVLSGLTIKNGSAEYAGAFYIWDASPTIMHCVITGNSCIQSDKHGGAFYIRNSSCIITDCEISNNKATSTGGGIFCYNSSPVITNCRFFHCTARNGGGAISIWSQSNVVISKCIITNNRVTFRSGGAINCRDSELSLSNCVIADNSANGDGGGLLLYGSDSTITNCTITGNSGGWKGGAIFFSLGTANITNCIIRSNTCSQAPEIAIYSWSGIIVDRGPAYTNPEDHMSVFALSYNTLTMPMTGEDSVFVYGDPDFLSLQWGPGNIDSDPGFVSPGCWDPNGTPDDPNDDFWVDGDYHLKSQGGRWDPISQSWVQDEVTSPCIDAGDPSSPIGFEPFPNGGIINIGARGGTAEASKSYFGEPVCETIVAGDINGDCKVDFADFLIMAFHWLEDKNL